MTVVVITRNRREQLAATLDELAALPERPPVIVVDNGSSDGTPSMVGRDFPAVRLVRAGANLGSAGRTIGASLAATRHVAFCDDDACWAPGALARASAHLDAHGPVAAVTGTVLVGPDRTVDPLTVVLAASPLRGMADGLPGPAVVGMMAGATMVKRQPFLDAGGFHPRYGVGGEERLLVLDLRAAGWEVCFVADVVVHHRPEPTGREPAVRRRTMARNDLWTAWLRYPLPGALAASGRRLWAAARAGDVPTAWGAAREALRGWRWARRERRPLPAGVMADVRLTEAGRPGGPSPIRRATQAAATRSFTARTTLRGR